MNEHQSNISSVIKQIEDIYGFSIKELTSKKRQKHIVKARFILCAALHKLGLSYSQIGSLLKRDHTTAMYAIFRAKALYIDEVDGLQLEPINLTDIKHPYLSTSKKWQHIYDLYGGKCAICGFSDVVQIHHIIPRSVGGKDTQENLLVLCPNHHALLHLGLVDIKRLSVRS